jgi:hypothetical protein
VEYTFTLPTPPPRLKSNRKQYYVHWRLEEALNPVVWARGQVCTLGLTLLQATMSLKETGKY